MRRLVAASVLGAGWLGVADAGPTRKVRVETSPQGATVYIESKENGPACDATPCTIELPVGETTLIVELASYNAKYSTVMVPRRGKVKLDPMTLEPAVGTIVVDGPLGARISVNGEDKGKAPQRIDVPAETHKVVLTYDGKTLFDQYVDVANGEEEIVAVRGSGGVATDPEVPQGGGGDGDGGGGGGGDVTKSAEPERERPPFVSLGAAFDVGFRAFRYDDADDLRDETESGQVLLGPIVEIWPGVLAGVDLLRGLSLVGRFQFGVNSNPVDGEGLSNMASTFWQSFEVSLRHKWLFAGKYGLEVGAGWVRDYYQFNGTTDDKLELPDAIYESIRAGAKLSMLVPAGVVTIEPFLDLENRVVRDGGSLQARFGPSTSAGGLRGAVGVVGRYGGTYLRLSAAVSRYSWTFEPEGNYMATGGTDMITLIGVYAGYAY